MSRRRRRPGRPVRAALVALLVLTAAPAVAPVHAAAGGAAQRLPEFSAPVVDAAGVVPDDVERQVNAALLDYQRRSRNQVAVAVVRTTGRTSLEDYTIDLAREWGVGTKGEDNGVLLLVAYDDRKVRIEVGRGLEGTLTDLESGRIIRQRLVPLLAQGDVGGAVVQGTGAIRQALGDKEVGALPPPPASEGGDGSGGPSPFVVLLPLFAFGLLGWSRRHMGGRGGGFATPIFWGGGWGGGGFGGGGGGGGFGGGGASGDW